MSVFATMTLKVTVELETDAGLMTSDAYEPPYDYLAVRRVEHTEVELHGDPDAFASVEHGLDEDLDPDELLLLGVRRALVEGSGSTLFSTD